MLYIFLDNILNKIKILSERNYESKINLLSRFTTCPYKKDKKFMSNYSNFKKIETKFIKVFSMENIFKISRNLKIMRKFILEQYERKILSLVNMPKKNMLNLNENIDKLSNLIFDNYKDNDLNSIKIIDLLELNEGDDKEIDD